MYVTSKLLKKTIIDIFLIINDWAKFIKRRFIFLMEFRLHKACNRNLKKAELMDEQEHIFTHSLTLIHRGVGNLGITYTMAKILKV